MHQWCHKVACLRPLLAYVAGLLMPVAAWQLAMTCFLSAVWFLLLHRFLSSRADSLWSIRWMPGAAILGCWLSVGLVAGEMTRQSTTMPNGFGEGATFSARVEVTVLPQERAKTWKLGVCVRESSVEAWLTRKLVVYLPKNEGVEHLELGDCISMEVKPSLPKNGGVDGFDYARWLRNKGYTATAFVKHWKKVAQADPWNLRAIGARLQERLVAVFQQAGMTNESTNLVCAMTLGARESLSGELNADFSRAGVTHVLSVSGLHVAIVYALMRFSLFFLCFTQRMRRFREVLIVCCLWGFALVTGFSPAVCRAVMMATLLVTAGVLGRSTSTMNTVLFSAWLQLLVDPLLVHDVGFQLSYLAVIGLVLFIPLLKQVWNPSSTLLKYVWGLLSMSFAAQLLTAPLTIHYFGQFPLYFLLSNMLAVPLSGLLMYVAVMCLLVSPFPWLFHVLSHCLSLCTALFIAVVQGVGRLPGSVLEGLSLSIQQVVVVYALIVCLSIWWMGKRSLFFRLSLVCVLLLQCLFLWEKFGGI